MKALLAKAPAAILALALVLLLGPALPFQRSGPAFAQGAAAPKSTRAAKPAAKKRRGILKWVDDKGSVHSTDDISKVPPQYRNQIEEVKSNIPFTRTKKKEEKQEIWGPYTAQMKKILDSPILMAGLIVSLLAGLLFIGIAVKAAVSSGPLWGFAILICNFLGVVYVWAKWKGCPITIRLLATVLWPAPIIVFFLP